MSIASLLTEVELGSILFWRKHITSWSIKSRDQLFTINICKISKDCNEVFLIKVSRRTRHCTGQATPRGVKLQGISSTIDGGSNLLSEIVPAMKSWTYYDRQFCLHWRWKELPSKIKACWPEHTFLVLINHTAVLAHVNLLPRPCHWGH